MEEQSYICKLCGKKMPVIGYNRANGKNMCFDWENRQYHKKCYKLKVFAYSDIGIPIECKY